MNYDVLLRLSFLHRALDGNKKEMNFVGISLVKDSTRDFPIHLTNEQILRVYFQT